MLIRWSRLAAYLAVEQLNLQHFLRLIRFVLEIGRDLANRTRRPLFFLLCPLVFQAIEQELRLQTRR